LLYFRLQNGLNKQNRRAQRTAANQAQQLEVLVFAFHHNHLLVHWRYHIREARVSQRGRVKEVLGSQYRGVPGQTQHVPSVLRSVL